MVSESSTTSVHRNMVISVQFLFSSPGLPIIDLWMAPAMLVMLRDFGERTVQAVFYFEPIKDLFQ